MEAGSWCFGQTDFSAWLELTDFKMRPHAPACLEQLIGLGSELQLPGKPLPQPCLQFFLIIVMLISCLAELMQPDLSKLCHSSGRKKQCLSALSSALSFFLFIIIVTVVWGFFKWWLCENARFILADMAANSYLLSLRDMIWICDVSLFIIHLLS